MQAHSVLIHSLDTLNSFVSHKTQVFANHLPLVSEKTECKAKRQNKVAALISSHDKRNLFVYRSK